jgi:hypothetical protein
MYRELHRDSTPIAYPVTHTAGEFQVVPVAGREVASALGNPDYRPAGAQLVWCDSVVHKAL